MASGKSVRVEAQAPPVITDHGPLVTVALSLGVNIQIHYSAQDLSLAV